MKLKYTGPKFLVSPTGINFSFTKEDKFIYIGTMVELIQVLDHNYEKDKTYSVCTEQKLFDEKQVIDLIRTYISDLDEQITMWMEKTAKAIEEEISRAKRCLLLSREEQDTLVKNIELMRSYRIQRTLNKTIYYAGVEALAGIIKQHHIDYITTSIDPKYFHLLHSLQGTLLRLHPSIGSEINILRKEENLIIELKILN